MGLFSFLLLFFPDYTISGCNYLIFGLTSATKPQNRGVLSLPQSHHRPPEGFCGLELQVKQKAWSFASLKHGFSVTSRWGE